ncbi:phosphoribosyl-ATP diphosphatase [Neisseria sp. Ec49-e6-T10]|uniref:phosphoribosyl-ATP diphosphatase n=1 Tax=Neisseria sp. Ec49-e6-T10 TaxID=3140744 RepID=UPI003EBD66BC
MTDQILIEIGKTLEERKQANAQSSYVASLFEAGEDKILRKVMEESTEVLLASKEKNPEEITKEVADLWFHSMVLLSYHNLTPEHVLLELKRREGLSGLTEKAMRKQNKDH